MSSMNGSVEIDCGFPGGNVRVDRIDGSDVYLQPDLRDTEGVWFYWYFRVKGRPGQQIHFHLSTEPNMDLTTSMGPAVSADEGKTWQWMGRPEESNHFAVELPADNPTLRLCMTVPYTHADLAEFLASIDGSPNVARGELTKSRQGRKVEFVKVGRLDGFARHRVLLLARSHCCETMASFVMEGILQRVLDDSETGRWMRNNVEFLVVPFVDADGVEEGDQGKNRRPHDHNRDYTAEPLYPETRAIMETVPEWSKGRLDVMLDLHCPWIRGESGENVHNVGSHDSAMWQQQRILSDRLKAHCKGPLPYTSENDLSFGESWNCHVVLPVGQDSSRWALQLPGISLSNCMEIPYALAGGVPVVPDNARRFGRDIADALRDYLSR